MYTSKDWLGFMAYQPHYCMLFNAKYFLYIKYDFLTHFVDNIFKRACARSPPVKWFYLFRFNMNNSIYYLSFICSQFNVNLTLLCIINNSIKHAFVYTQLNDQTVPFQRIQFNLRTQ